MIKKMAACLTAIILTLTTILTYNTIQAQSAKKVKQMAYADSSRLVEIFKDLHQNPELGFMEVRTAAIVANKLKELGYKVIQTRNILLNAIKWINEGLAIAYNLPKDLYPVMNIKGNAYPLLNDTAFTNKINARLATVVNSEKIITNIPPIMSSEDFYYLGMHHKKTVYDYLFIGTANQDIVVKANEKGEKYPFYHHSGNYQVDLSTIPPDAIIGTTALLANFEK